MKFLVIPVLPLLKMPLICFLRLPVNSLGELIKAFRLLKIGLRELVNACLNYSICLYCEKYYCYGILDNACRFVCGLYLFTLQNFIKTY